MNIGAVGLKAYSSALSNFNKTEQVAKSGALKPQEQPVSSFAETLNNSLDKVNGMQAEKKQAIESFASGESQNVHELMITMQKAGLAMNMTAAVRNKVMEAYRELSRIQF